jgi:hypothetical protein
MTIILELYLSSIPSRNLLPGKKCLQYIEYKALDEKTTLLEYFMMKSLNYILLFCLKRPYSGFAMDASAPVVLVRRPAIKMGTFSIALWLWNTT